MSRKLWFVPVCLSILLSIPIFAQDEGEPEENPCPNLTDISETGTVDNNGEGYAVVLYTNEETGQDFRLNIIGTSDEVDAFIDEAQLCLIASAEDLEGQPIYPVPTEIVDIPFADMFLEGLEELDFNLPDLVMARDGDTLTDQTLRDLLIARDIDSDEWFNTMYDAALAEISLAVDEGRLSPERAEIAEAEMSTMYSEFLDEVNLPLLETREEEADEDSLIVEFELLSAGDAPPSEEGYYLVTLNIDPWLARGRSKIYRPANSLITFTKIEGLCVSQGRVKGVLKFGTIRQFVGQDVAGGSCLRTESYLATRVKVVGLDVNNYYTIRIQFGNQVVTD